MVKAAGTCLGLNVPHRCIGKYYTMELSVGAPAPTTYGVQVSFFVNMGFCAPTTYGVQVSFFESMGICAPTTYGEGYTTFLLFIYSVVYKQTNSIFGRNIVKAFINKVMKIQRRDT
jgi:hypothetical protein